VGFSAASPRLSDKIRYPLFFRINAPETILNKAIVTLLRRFGWKQIAIVKQDEDLFNDEKKARIMISLMYADKSRLIMCAAYRHRLYGSHIQWMLPGWYEQDWWRIRNVPGCSAENIRTAAANFLAVEDLVVDTTTNNTLSGLTAEEFMKMYQAKLTHYPYSPNGYTPLGYDAVWVLALGLDKTLTQRKEQGRGCYKIQ